MCEYKYGILSTAKKNERQELLRQLSEGEISVLFATYSIAKEGLDIPCLRNLVMASPVKDEITVTQSAGRVMRKYPDKEYGIIWDFEDNMREQNYVETKEVSKFLEELRSHTTMER